MFNEIPTFGIEALAYNARANFFPLLVNKFQKILDHEVKSVPRRLEDANIPKLVFDEFGINITLGVTKSTQMGAWVIPPDLKVNHALLSDYRNAHATGMSAMKYLKGGKFKSIQGSISRATGKVSGDFSKLVSEIQMTSAMFDGTFTASELAASLSHEIGHIWSYFECLALSLSMNYALDAVLQELSGTNDIKLNFELIVALEEATGTKIKDVKVLASTRSTEKLHTVVINEVFRQRISSTENGNLYDTTGWEFQSDQFVSRLGGGKHLATALNKITMASGDPSHWNGLEWYFWQIMVFILSAIIFTPLLLVIFFIFVVSGTHPGVSEYDSTQARFKRIRSDIVGSLRNTKLSTDDIRETLAHIDDIEKIIDGVVDREPWLNSIMIFCWNPFRKQSKEMKLQQLLEELANNPLLVTAARFKTA